MTSLLDTAQQQGTPLIDGESVTFVWQGAKPPALRGDFNDWDVKTAPPWRQEATDVWTVTLTFPADAYIE